MLKLYTWTTPNGYKVPIMLEELGVEFELIPVDITKGEQKKPEFLALNPNHKIPVLVDEEADGGALALFESGAILMYLGDKYGKFFSKGVRERAQEVEWLMFQMANVGPMFGQANHFLKYAPEKVEYGIKRYIDEAKRQPRAPGEEGPARGGQHQLCRERERRLGGAERRPVLGDPDAGRTGIRSRPADGGSPAQAAGTPVEALRQASAAGRAPLVHPSSSVSESMRAAQPGKRSKDVGRPAGRVPFHGPAAAA